MKSSYLVSGLMSGTSLDGVDMALCRFHYENSGWQYKMIDAVTIGYPDSLRRILKHAMELDKDGLKETDVRLGEFFADELNQFHRKNKVKPDLISSHGHTVFHDPDNHFTLQIGNGQVMADKTSVTVVNNFRMKDVEHGGQGAPLVPVGDRLLFGNYDVCLNIGGIANLSFEDGNVRRGYDICPANMALNYLAEKKGQTFDMDGKIASTGKCFDALLSELNNLGYFKKAPPKTIGREWFEREFLPVINSFRLPVEDLLATVTEHIARQISRILEKFHDPSILVTGGGAFNNYLMERIRNVSGLDIPVPERNLVKHKESLIFGFLGVLRMRKEINCYASVTGASMDLCAGEIFNPPESRD